MTSTVGFGPLERVDGPPPLEQMYGLLQAAKAPAAGVRIVPDTDGDGIERWINGVEVYPYPTDVADVHDPCAPGSTRAPKGFGDSTLQRPQFGALTMWIAETCTASRVWNQEEYKARAAVALDAVDGAGVAHEFMTGQRLPLNPHLSDGTGTFPNGDAATSVANGIALLEAEIAKSHRLGLIHCSPQMVTIARERFAVDNRTGVIRTINGIPVIADFGYVLGATPPNHAHPGATQEWMYATGPIDVRRTELFLLPERVEDALDRGVGMAGASSGRTNAITYRAERYYLVDWDTEVHASVLVDRCKTDC